MSFIHSRKLLNSAMLLRQPYRKFDRRLHPKYLQTLLKVTKKPEPLKYRIHPPQIPISLQKPHQAPLKPCEKLPFFIERTTSGNLPVYIKYRENHNIKRTIIRKITGNVQLFAEELKKVVSNAEVRIKVGKIQIPGVHKESVETWLLRLGL